MGSRSPVDVLGLTTGVGGIAAGGSFFSFEHTCALIAADGIRCWGYNGIGELGNGSQDLGSSIPVDVIGIKGSPTPTATQTASPTAIATPTPPPPVGGISFDPEVPPPKAAGRRIDLLIAVAAAGAVTMGGAAWYARRRRRT